MTEPRTFVPKLLNFERARKLHDCEAMELDLLLAKSCFESIGDRRFGVVFVPKLLASNSVERAAWCSFVSGAIYYRRCFKSGVRTKITNDDIAPHLSDDEMLLHRDLVDIADKHVAHSVNEMELGCTTIHVAVDSSGKVHRGGLGSNARMAGPFSIKGYADICSMISSIVEAVLKPMIASHKQLVLETIQAMTDDQILQLPDGHPPHIENLRFGTSRNWPPRNGA